jgi:RNA polymerase sigma-70 factor (ECF subfamily)
LTDIQPEADLVSRSLAGDAGAFAELCERHRARLWRIIASVAQGPDLDDLAQEAVLRAWCSLRSWRSEAPFEAWLYRIALNVAHDYQRSAWKRRVVFWVHGAQTSEGREEASEPLHDVAERREMQRRVRQAVAALPARQGIPIWLHYFEGFSLAEVARLERVSESTTRSRVQVGLRRLAHTLRDLTDTEETSSAAAPSEDDFGRGRVSQPPADSLPEAPTP